MKSKRAPPFVDETSVAPRAIPHRPLWVGLCVAVCYAVYGTGLWAKLGDHVSLTIALATPAALVPGVYLLYRIINRKQT